VGTSYRAFLHHRHEICASCRQSFALIPRSGNGARRSVSVKSDGGRFFCCGAELRVSACLWRAGFRHSVENELFRELWKKHRESRESAGIHSCDLRDSRLDVRTASRPPVRTFHVGVLMASRKTASHGDRCTHSTILEWWRQPPDLIHKHPRPGRAAEPRLHQSCLTRTRLFVIVSAGDIRRYIPMRPISSSTSLGRIFFRYCTVRSLPHRAESCVPSGVEKPAPNPVSFTCKHHVRANSRPGSIGRNPTG